MSCSMFVINVQTSGGGTRQLRRMPRRLHRRWNKWIGESVCYSSSLLLSMINFLLNRIHTRLAAMCDEEEESDGEIIDEAGV